MSCSRVRQDVGAQSAFGPRNHSYLNASRWYWPTDFGQSSWRRRRKTKRRFRRFGRARRGFKSSTIEFPGIQLFFFFNSTADSRNRPYSAQRFVGRSFPTRVDVTKSADFRRRLFRTRARYGRTRHTLRSLSSQ